MPCNYEAISKLPTCAVENRLEILQLKDDLQRAEVSTQTCCDLARVQNCLQSKLSQLDQCKDEVDKTVQQISNELEGFKHVCESKVSIFCNRWYEWPLIIYIVFVVLFLVALVLLTLFCCRKYSRQRKY